MFSCCISCAAIVMRRAQTFAVLSRWQQAIINFLKPNVCSRSMWGLDGLQFKEPRLEASFR